MSCQASKASWNGKPPPGLENLKKLRKLQRLKKLKKSNYDTNRRH